MARALVRPLIGTPVRPNHLTTLRLLFGAAACGALAVGTYPADLWAGGLWLVSAFLDRADGELARIGNMMSPGGHLYDYIVDTGVNAGFFLAMGIGQRHSALGLSALALGIAASASMLLASYIAEEFEKRSAPGVKTVMGRWGFDPDDALYILGPLCWCGDRLLLPCLVLAALGTTGFMLSFAARLLLLKRRLAAA